MCGLFGWQWSKQPDHNTCRVMAHELAKAMDKRGGQAWGVWSKRLVHRGLGPATPHHQLFMGHDSMFGHSRWATHGKNVIENAHPFYEGGISLSHNGVISNHSALNTKHKRNYAVDSRHLLSNLVEGKPFSEIEAYGAITWARDKDEDCIYMGLLSSSGSFHVVETTHGVVWASTKSAVDDACAAAKLEIVSVYQLDPGKAYFAEKGKLFIDEGHSSILVTQPVVVQHWSSYGSTSYTTLWCNKHKKRYAQCPCKGRQAHIVEVLTSAVPKDGETGVEYEPPKYTGSTSTGGPMLPFCARAMCMKRQTARGILCEEHQGESDATRINTGSHGSSSPRGVPPFCRALSCFKPRKNWEATYCAKHEAEEEAKANRSKPTAPEPIRLTQLAPAPAPLPAPDSQRSQFVREMRAAWADDAEGPSEAARKQMKCDLAEWWLEDNVGGTSEYLAGMTPSEVLELAEELGFDAEQAVNEALTVTQLEQKAPHANPEPEAKSEASIQQPETKHEPSDGGAVAALDGGAGS